MWPFNQRKTGVLEKIELTFGGRGNQNMTISGERYATWIDYRQWPKVGDTVSFNAYFDQGLRCADDLKVKNTAPTADLE